MINLLVCTVNDTLVLRRYLYLDFRGKVTSNLTE